jgi:Ran GTPase-activating protein (RanGAP) involved in mRNA processing and transport
MGCTQAKSKGKTPKSEAPQEQESQLTRLAVYLDANKAVIHKKLIPFFEDALDKHVLDHVELRLSFVPLIEERLQDLVEVLPCYLHLSSLRLWKARLGPQGMKTLAPALANLIKLKELGLEDNELGDEGAMTLSPALMQLNHLEGLHLHINQITNQGVRSVSKSLEGKTHLKILNLSENQISATGAEELLKQLASFCHNLDTLSMASNSLGPESSSLLVTYIPKLPALTKLFIDNSQLPANISAQLQGYNRQLNIFS